MDTDHRATIIFWFGEEQSFGRPGHAQRQVNVLGNVALDGTSPMEASFRLNDEGGWRPLTLGCDLHRLATPGDFNVEIERAELRPGPNLLEVRVTCGNSEDVIARASMRLHHEVGCAWPLPFLAKWREARTPQDFVQVVDGNWRLTPDGLRVVGRYYDRMIALGDETWTDYEVRSSFRLHDYTPPATGAPSYDVAHVAIATRWPGHARDSFQPNRQWYPLGATAELRFEASLRNARWRIFDGERFYMEAQSRDYRQLELESRYRIVHRVQDLEGGRTLHSVKLWPDGDGEPERWDLQAIQPRRTLAGGSACLIAHHTDVTFGDIEVVPVPSGGL